MCLSERPVSRSGPLKSARCRKSDVPGEESWPTQPYPTAPPPFARQSFTVDDINPYLPEEQRALIKDQLLSWRNEGLFTPPTLRGTVQMPGDQGGSNWGTTAANPTNGIVYVLGVNAPAVIRLEKSAPGIPAPNDGFWPQGGGGGGGGGRGLTQAFAGRALYVQNCQSCHGADLKGATAPSLVDITVEDGSRRDQGDHPGRQGRYALVLQPHSSRIWTTSWRFSLIRRRRSAAAARRSRRDRRGRRPPWVAQWSRPARRRLDGGGRPGRRAQPSVAEGCVRAGGSACRQTDAVGRKRSARLRRQRRERRLSGRSSTFPMFDTTAHGPFPTTPSNHHGPRSRRTI